MIKQDHKWIKDLYRNKVSVLTTRMKLKTVC